MQVQVIDSGYQEALATTITVVQALPKGDRAKEAIELWIETALDLGQSIPSPSLITELQQQHEYKGWVWAIAEIDPALLSDEIERVNITLPKRVLARLDAKAKAVGETRSGYIAHLAISA
jgi:hypothetical protein